LKIVVAPVRAVLQPIACGFRRPPVALAAGDERPLAGGEDLVAAAYSRPTWSSGA
jgi:hypothetical protein